MAQSQSNVDRFSFLPEEILIFIVSLLPLREAVRTSVLSKRWYKLWTYCTSIEFDETNFTGTIHDDQQLQDSGQSAGTLRQMKKVRSDIVVESVHHTLQCLQSPKISRLDVRFGYRTRYCDFVNEWISLCLRKNIEELHFDFSVGAFHRFDFDPFNEGLFCLRDSVHATGSKSLWVLSLSFCNLGSPSFHGFPALKKVSLARLGLRKEVVENLVDNCLLLKTLSLVECRYLDHIKISHPRLRLRRLIVRDCQPLTKGIDLYAPCLQYFEYFGPVVFFQLYRLTSLVEAVLDFGLQRGFHSVSMKLSNLLLVDLYRAKSLTVCGYLLRILPAEDATSFHQLRRPLPHLKNLTMVTTLDKYELIGAFSLL
ncbi:PREDICTED: putative F-box protein At3g29830 [Nelumbo nucifera]|uniref:F-box protein At3g29830 n=1 Tax=Nelumbo nucifera TaxID=4432 RepID=A0A1U8Q7I8_NELNU|nr:PREDICTED: putative F-box protein At3g29830 [Nelumbo nucifera]